MRISYWLAALQHILCIHSAFDGNGVSLQHQPTSFKRFCVVFLLPLPVGSPFFLSTGSMGVHRSIQASNCPLDVHNPCMPYATIINLLMVSKFCAMNVKAVNSMAIKRVCKQLKPGPFFFSSRSEANCWTYYCCCDDLERSEPKKSVHMNVTMWSTSLQAE